MPKELKDSDIDADDKIPENSNVTLLGSLVSLSDSIHLAKAAQADIFRKQHLNSALKNLQILCEYIEKNKCNFIVFDNPPTTIT